MSDETVRISKARKERSDMKVFHTRECDHYPHGGEDIPREDAEVRGLRECKWCAGTSETSPGRIGGDRDYGELVERLRGEMGIKADD